MLSVLYQIWENLFYTKFEKVAEFQTEAQWVKAQYKRASIQITKNDLLLAQPLYSTMVEYDLLPKKFKHVVGK